MKVLTLDLGQNMGYAIWDNWKLIKSGEEIVIKISTVKDLKQAEVDDHKDLGGMFTNKQWSSLTSEEKDDIAGERMMRIVKHIIRMNSIDLVIFEKAGRLPSARSSEVFQMYYNSVRFAIIDSKRFGLRVNKAIVNNASLSTWIKKTHGETYVKTDEQDAIEVGNFCIDRKLHGAS